MIMSVVKTICAEQWRYWLRTKVATTVLILGAVMTLAALLVNAFHIEEAAHVREHLQSKAEQSFKAQPDKHPHRMVHYGHYVFRTPTPLSIIEPGVDPYTGTAIFLEGHRQNNAMFAEQRQAAGLNRFSSLTPSFLALVLAPLFIILIGYGSVSREREAGTLTLLLSQGTTRWQLLFGKLLALCIASGVFLLPLLLACLYIALSSGSAAVVALFSLSYAVYFLLWALVVTACSALMEKSSASFTVLIVIWMSACVLLPRLGSSIATNLAPSMGKLEADFKVEERLRSLGDGHDANDPAFNNLKAELLAKYNVNSVDDLPVNYRGVVAQYSEQRQAEVLNEFADNRMQQELEQARIARQFGWLSPAVAIRSISTVLAGTSLETHHRFLREAETLRLAFVQGLNKIHAEKLDYKLDMNRNASEEAADKAVVDSSNWSLLAEFNFEPEKPATRLSNATVYFLQLLFWMGITVLLLRIAVRRLNP
ncbi:ABC transporter permease [Alteromonas sp. A081]|uniref:ABC transporter permease n=1 Tax=Alteromonas sp. A081 TaxID=3410269 RepID=UPI003B9878D3